MRNLSFTNDRIDALRGCRSLIDSMARTMDKTVELYTRGGKGTTVKCDVCPPRGVRIIVKLRDDCSVNL